MAILTNKRKLARVLISPYMVLTSHLRAMPNFIIIGAAKCGTTSLYNYLIKHPNINPAFQKEPNFFSKHFNKGITFYKSQFPFRRKGFITGEASTSYFSYPPAPHRIAKIIPSTKLVVLLRNPIDRAYSLYYHNLKHLGNKDSYSFKEAINKEPERWDRELGEIVDCQSSCNLKNYYRLYKKHYHHAYLHRCIYIKFIRQWLNIFPREQLLVLKSEDLYEDPVYTYQKTLQFFNLPEHNLREYNKHNPNHYPEMDTATRNYLVGYFKPYNRLLSEYLKIDFDWDK